MSPWSTLRQEPIQAITASGIKTGRRSFDLDVIVFATGFDAMTGAITAVHPIAGRGGQSISDVWASGPKTYLGLTAAGFPNLFMITGPGSPSVLSNMTVSIEQHADWVVDRLVAMRGRVHRHRGDRDGPGRLGAAHGRLLAAHAASAGQHLVHRRERAGQGAGPDALHGRRRSLPHDLRRGREPRHAGLHARAAPMAPRNATTARSCACSPTCGWC